MMPHTLAEHEYELHMPMMANPRAYFRFPNATEAYRSHRLAVSQQSTALSSAVSSQSDGGPVERVLTDDSGLKVTGSTVVYNGVKTVQLTAENLKVCPCISSPVEHCCCRLRRCPCLIGKQGHEGIDWFMSSLAGFQGGDTI